jgi:hypothetical protein
MFGIDPLHMIFKIMTEIVISFPSLPMNIHNIVIPSKTQIIQKMLVQ